MNPTPPPMSVQPTRPRVLLGRVPRSELDVELHDLPGIEEPLVDDFWLRKSHRRGGMR